MSTVWLTVLLALLTISTRFSFSAGLFFTFVITNGIMQAAAGSYLQTAAVAIASLFGPDAMQAMMSGQAFVGVVVSGVQLLSSAASIHAANDARIKLLPYDEGAAEKRAAALFFGLSTLFLCATLAAEAWLVRMPEYKAIVYSIESKSHGGGLLGEEDTIDTPHEKGRILHVAKANLRYEIAVGYVFAVTLVSSDFMLYFYMY